MDANHSAWPLAWVSLDAGDNDPLRFWTYVITALNTLHPGVGESSLALLYTASSPIEDVLTALLNALNQLPSDTVLVLDDYHFIEAKPIHDALTFLVEHLPPKLHLVLASRSDPLLPLARLRARGVLSELRAAALRFTVEETAAFLTEVMGLPLSAKQVAALQDRTEGWIAGLQLAALSLQGRENVAGFFSEVLRTRLQQTEPALVPELHRRACGWYEQHELVDEAIPHALAVPDLERAARLMQRHSWSSNFLSQFQMFRGWLNRLPETFVRTHPLLCIMHAMTLLLTHQLERAAARIQDAERCLVEEMPADQRRTILAAIAASRGTLARLLGDYEQAVPLAQQTLDLLPEMEETLLRRMVYPTTLLTAASSYLVDGDLTSTTERRVEETVMSMHDCW